MSPERSSNNSGTILQWRPGVKVSRNLSLKHFGCIVFYSPNPRAWAQRVSNVCYSNPIVNQSFEFHIFTIINLQCWLLLQQNFKKQYEIMFNTFIRSLIIWEPDIEIWAQEINWAENKLGARGTVPPPWKLYFNSWRRHWRRRSRTGGEYIIRYWQLWHRVA